MSTELSRRFKAIDTPMALPGCCYVCRSHEGPFIDTAINEDFFGTVYLCKRCIAEMAEEFGLVTPETLAREVGQKDFYEMQLTHTKESLEKVRKENDELRTAILALGRSGDSSMDGVDNTENDKQSDGDSGEAESKDATISPGTIKGSVKSRSK